MRANQMQQPRPFGLSCRRNPTTYSFSFNSSFISCCNCKKKQPLQPLQLCSKNKTCSVRAAANTGDVQLTASDSELASRGFAVRRTAEGLDVGALNEVFSRVGFPRRQEERLRRALEHSQVVWLSAAAEGGRPVAFARAAGDGVFNAVVWDVVVEPSCQGLGLGRAVMERLVQDLRRDGVSNIVLYAEPRVVGFYRLLDFAMDPDGIRGMAYYRKARAAATTTN